MYMRDTLEQFLKPYNPAKAEATMYTLWEASGFFNPDMCIKHKITSRDAGIFSIVLPPPNVTGTLHVGHAAMLALEDILIRYHRMRGFQTLWIPGTDHAAIATQSKVEEILFKKEKKTRHDLGRDAFLSRVQQFANDSHDTIVNQVKRMGSSVDWSREAFTLDDRRSLAVRTAFKNMYDAGLIFRGARIVNWDPKLQTTVSDDEMQHEERVEHFYYLKYGPFTIGTARPETKFGDKYVVMHPKDKRYEKYVHGETFELEWINGPIAATIIKDEAVDMDFGTGVMTITPWHDATDFDIAERHKLEREQIIDFNGKLLPIAGEFEGTHITKARPLIVKKLTDKGLVEKVDEKYVHNIALNERGRGMIEPQIKEQWFIDVEKEFTLPHSDIKGILTGSTTTLKDIMRKTVENGQINMLPERFKKTYFHWINNLRPWCISRQIWYGHRIPVWYRGDEVYCGIEAPNGDGWEQDPDTLDTWFSSGLWTFSTLGWPDKSEDLTIYHPTSVLETGYDILFFWVARMILMTGYHLGTIPFHTVYLHGLVRDEKGRKMSKSLGNIVDPLDFIDTYGADALRMALVIGAPPGNDVSLSEDKIRGYKHFANKLWNLARFVLTNTSGIDLRMQQELHADDQKLVLELTQISHEVRVHIDEYQLYLAAEKLYHYIWDRFAAEIVEDSKSILAGDDEAAKVSRQLTLYRILVTSLKLLHPFMPFVTETIWQALPEKDSDILMVAPWPDA
jgi:valyl-tRNA synthetase